MGLFSRRDKAPKAESGYDTAHSNASFHSGASRGMPDRSSGGSLTSSSARSPKSVKIPKVDLPRPPDPQLDPAGYLRSLGAVRERSRLLYQKALRNELKHFDVDFTKFPDVVSFVSNLIKVSLVCRDLEI